MPKRPFKWINLKWINYLTETLKKSPMTHAEMMNILLNIESHPKIIEKTITYKNNKINITKRIHPAWEDWMKKIKYPKTGNSIKNETIKSLKLRKSPFGKWIEKYSSKKGDVSLIKLEDYNFDKKSLWEIYAFGNPNLFIDVERFQYKKEAIKRIKEILC